MPHGTAWAFPLMHAENQHGGTWCATEKSSHWDSAKISVHQPELARSALGQPGDNHQPDRGDTDAGRPEGSLRTRPRALPPGREDYGRPDVQPEYRAGTIPWRLELHDSSQTTLPQMNQLFLNEPYESDTGPWSP